MAGMKVYVLLFTAFYSGLMQLSMAQEKPVVAAARVIDTQAIDQAIAYMLLFAALQGEEKAENTGKEVREDNGEWWIQLRQLNFQLAESKLSTDLET
ncbi:hypothetical protein EJB05_16172, partial [Eragrostis curvula]